MPPESPPPSRTEAHHGDPTRHHQPPPATLDEDSTWLDHATCKGADPAIFIPPINLDTGRPIITPELTAEAQAFCDVCSVTEICREVAISRREPGWWGNTSGSDRRKIRAARFNAVRDSN